MIGFLIELAAFQMALDSAYRNAAKKAYRKYVWSVRDQYAQFCRWAETGTATAGGTSGRGRSGHGTIRIPAGSSTADAEKFLTMLRIALTQLLEKQYDAAVKVNSIRVATAQADCVALELEIEIFGEAPSRTYVEIIK
jgi:hypothetical protein